MRRRLRGVLASAVACLLLAGCATHSGTASTPPPSSTDTQATSACVAPTGPIARPDYCALPPDVRAFIDDRDACDHFRGEPWPEGDAPQDRERRRDLVERVRTLCAGTDAQLQALAARYRDDAAVQAVLGTFEQDVEAD